MTLSQRPGLLEIREALESGRVRVTLRGALDLSTAPRFAERIAELHAERTSVLIDLAILEFMDSTGVTIIVQSIKSSRSDDWDFAIDPNLSPQVRKLFQLTNVDQFAVIDGADRSAA